MGTATAPVAQAYGNWFTAENPNKELRVLAQSYDWLIFLTDKGISEFITDLLIRPTKKFEAVQSAFRFSYSGKKDGNVFTKVKMDFDADSALNTYFQENRERIEGWFNVISPKKKPLSILRKELSTLCQKDWWRIYQ